MEKVKLFVEKNIAYITMGVAVCVCVVAWLSFKKK